MPELKKKPATATPAPQDAAGNGQAPAQAEPAAPTKKEITAKIKEIDKAEASAERKVLYPEFKSTACVGEKALTAAKAKALLGWEDETEFKARTGLTEVEDAYGNTFLLKDENGVKVRCKRNIGNRPLDEQWARCIAQDVLNRRWHFNGEAIIIGKTGIVLSGQHRLIALVLAHQIWEKKGDSTVWREKWPTEPVIETVVNQGVEETQAVKETIDEVKARTIADSLYTADICPTAISKKPHDKRIWCRMLDKALSLMWKRTGAGGVNQIERYQTHGSSLGFLERHPKLKQAVTHIFQEDEENTLSARKLSPGDCAAAMYLMAAGKSDQFKYRNAVPAPRETMLDLSLWGKAEAFFAMIAAGKQSDAGQVALRMALAGLIDEDNGTGGRPTEKLEVLAKAWAFYKDGKPFKESDLRLRYEQDENGNDRLAEDTTFGGIDLGHGKKYEPDPDAPDAETLEKTKAEKRKESAAALDAAAKKKPAADEVAQKIAERRKNGVYKGKAEPVTK